MFKARLVAALMAALNAPPAWAAEPIIITATKMPEPVSTVPAADTVIIGDDIRARGAFDLRSALASAGGVEVLPASDAGPVSSVVAAQGLAEMDAYLLVVDGVPFGGAFNPATATLDLIDVDRIEVLRGAAPVTFGATSFVGVINVIRFDAGQQPTRAMLQAGTRSSARAAFATSLSTGSIGQSFLGSVETRGFSQDRGKFTRGHLLYRAGTALGAGRVHLDLEAIKLNQTPYSPHPTEDGGLSTRYPLDANINPSDARADQNRLQATLGYDTTLGGVNWTTTLSSARTSARNTRGFLRPDFDAGGATSNADGYRQQVRITDLYFDSHLAGNSTPLDWIAGVDWLYGKGRQRSANFEYGTPVDGSHAPNSHSLHIDESTVLTDRRSFMGAYAQAVVRPIPPLSLLAGLRLNRTNERRCGGQIDGAQLPHPDICQTLTKTRLAGSVGASFTVLRKGSDFISAFADYRNTYKPAAIDFGPEAEGDILKPETAQGWEAGFKMQQGIGHLSGEVSYFDTRFQNLVIRENVGGLPSLANAGREHFRGVEAEVRWSPAPNLILMGSYAHHLARFTDYPQLEPDGTIEQLAGKRLASSPKDLASALITYSPPMGPQGSVTLRYIGSRFLDRSNTITAKAYATIDGRVGYKLKGGWAVYAEAENLTNRRDPVTESELGDAQFYRLSGRRILATVSYGY